MDAYSSYRPPMQWWPMRMMNDDDLLASPVFLEWRWCWSASISGTCLLLQYSHIPLVQHRWTVWPTIFSQQSCIAPYLVVLGCVKWNILCLPFTIFVPRQANHDLQIQNLQCLVKNLFLTGSLKIPPIWSAMICCDRTIISWKRQKVDLLKSPQNLWLNYSNWEKCVGVNKSTVNCSLPIFCHLLKSL